MEILIFRFQFSIFRFFRLTPTKDFVYLKFITKVFVGKKCR
jgi:hypothetical protein